MSAQVVLDTSVIAKLVLPEQGSDEARALVEEHLTDKIYAPALVKDELAQALFGYVSRNLMTIDQAETALQAVAGIGIQFVDRRVIRTRAFAIARDAGARTIYDAEFVALAESLHCEMWTADHHLYSVFSTNYPFVRLLGATA